jgi:hypothetical protein
MSPDTANLKGASAEALNIAATRLVIAQCKSVAEVTPIAGMRRVFTSPGIGCLANINIWALGYFITRLPAVQGNTVYAALAVTHPENNVGAIPT